MNKTAIVTGAASGIGLEVTRSLCNEDYSVIALDINHVEYYHVNLTAVKIDLRLEEDLAKFFSEISCLDVAVNCAGVPCERKDLLEFSAEDITAQWQNNFLATFNAIREELKIMRQNRKGKVINISSISAHRGMRNFLGYSCAKASISNLTKVAAAENAEYNIQVNAISPATIDTRMIRNKYDGCLPDYSKAYPVGACGMPKDVFSAVKFFIDNAFTTGYDLILDGGISDLLELSK